jgi:glyoxylase-like metal-dependent hydrolase (beta-lactamase superfamily II)
MKLNGLIALAAFTALATPVLAQAPAAPRPPAFAPSDLPLLQRQDQEVKQLKPGLFMVVGAGGNTTVRVTDAGLVVVDTKNIGQPIYDALMAQIRTVSDKPVKYVIDTHNHGDHSGNNARFAAAGAEVIGQKNAPARYTPAANGREAAAPPTSTYDTRRTLRLGGKRVELYHFGPGHTDNDTVVYFPDLKVVAMGDLFTIATPFINYPGGGSVLGAQKALKEVMKLDFDTVVPGHGFDPVPRERLARYIADLDRVIAATRKAIAAGTPKEQILPGLHLDYLSWNLSAPQWSSPAQLDGYYDELTRK